MIPQDAVREALKDLLMNIRLGAADFTKETGQAVRLGRAQITMEVSFDGAEVVRERQETTQEAGSKTTTTTEQPIGTDSTNHGEVTTTVKTGSYTQAGTQSSSQGGGSSETVNYDYDPTGP